MLRLLQQLNETGRKCNVLWGEERICVTDDFVMAHTADTAHVLLQPLRQVVVEDNGQAMNVETQVHVGGDHDRILPPEEVEGGVTLLLRTAVVDGQRPEPLQEVLQLVDSALGLHEDQHFVRVPADLVQQVHQLLALLRLLDEPDVLTQAIARAVSRDAHPVAHELLRKRAHLLRPRGGEHERLPVRAHLAEDRRDLRLETHVEHPVGLVKHDEGGALQVRLAVLQEVDDAARRGRHDLCAVQVHHLLTLHGSAVHARRADVARRHLPQLLVDLHGQFARRRHEQDDRTVAALQGRLREDVKDGRQGERQRLARPGRRDTHKVVARQGDRPQLGLDRRRLDVPLEPSLHVVREVGLLEGQDRLGDDAAALRQGHRDVGSLAPLVNVFSLPVLRHRARLVRVLRHLSQVLRPPVHLAQVPAQVGHAVTRLAGALPPVAPTRAVGRLRAALLPALVAAALLPAAGTSALLPAASAAALLPATGTRAAGTGTAARLPAAGTGTTAGAAGASALPAA
eukprot:Rhum_TRINITY_DN14219_c0_g1::Rhum_TRINITY_DN14219_c0_g1_i1::g.73711::m.73711